MPQRADGALSSEEENMIRHQLEIMFRNHRNAQAGRLAGPILSQIEKGVRTGAVDVLRRIADTLKVDLDDIA